MLHIRTIGTLHNQIRFPGVSGINRIPAPRTFARRLGTMGDDDVVGDTTGEYYDTSTSSADDTSALGEDSGSAAADFSSSTASTPASTTSSSTSSSSGSGLTIDSGAVNAIGGIFSTLTNALGLTKPATTVIVNNAKTSTPSTIMGVNTKYLLYGGAALLALVLLRKK